MSESNLSTTYWDLRREVSRYLGLGTPYSEGTVTVAATAATITGGVWPAWAAAGTLVNKATGAKIAVSSRTSDTVLVLAASGTWAGVAFELNEWSSDDTTNIVDYINSGIRRFYNPPITQNRKRSREWSFLSPVDVITTSAPYDTGTITIVAGVVTLAGGTFPSWAADGEIQVDVTDVPSSLRVATRDSGTQLTLEDTTIAVAAGTEYSLPRTVYALPDDWAGMIDKSLTYNAETTGYSYAVPLVGELQLREMRQQYNQDGQPNYATTRTRAGTGTTGQRSELLFYPNADAVYPMEYRYRKNASALSAANPYPLGGMDHSDTIIASCLAEAELRTRDRADVWRTKFQELLMTSVDRDERLASPKSLGVDRTGDFECGEGYYGGNVRVARRVEMNINL
jgi:hypothetical protein